MIADTSVFITVKAKGVNGCEDSATIQVLVDPLTDIYLPTAFTPNGDGKNDLFKVLGGEFAQFNLKVFNRWGQVVFTTTERAKGWDGKVNGELQPAQVFVYILQGKLKNGKVVMKKGTVMLVR
jgi:gliding motility-associated-like protein